MKIWKLVSGIVSIPLSLLIMMQASAVGVLNALEENGELGGTAGYILAFGMFVGGICSICLKNKEMTGGILATFLIFFGIPSFLAYSLAGSYGDLNIWAIWSTVCAIVAIIDFMKLRVSNKDFKKEIKDDVKVK